jgi:hypothetical protein
MSAQLTPLLMAAMGFAYIGGIAFVDLVLVDRGALRLGGLRAVPACSPSHAVLVAAEHDVGRAPVAVPIGYVAYFVLPAVMGAGLGRWCSAKFHWRKPTALLTVGLLVGSCGPSSSTRSWGPTRSLLLRPRDPRACAVGGD